jgi:hypothetical protein
MLSASGAHKPSFSALSHVMSSSFAGVSPVVLNLRRVGASILASGSAPVGDFMALEAFQGSVLRYRVFPFILDRFNHFRIPLPSVLGTHGLRVRVYQYTTGPAHDAEKAI